MATFTSGAKLRYLKVTVPFTPMGPNKTAPFRITYKTPEGHVAHLERNELLKFRFEEDGGHTFDSVQAQVRYGWTDLERYIVEQYLCDPRNGYFKMGDGRGIFPNEDADKIQEVLAATKAPECDAYVVDEGQLVKCSNEATHDGKCAEHQSVPAPT